MDQPVAVRVSPPSLLARYYAGTATLAAKAWLIFMVTLAAAIWGEIAARGLPVQGLDARFAFLGIIRVDDGRPAQSVNPHLLVGWIVGIALVSLVILPLAARIGGFGQSLILALALCGGGSAANALALVAQGTVHNWLAIIISEHHPVSYSLGDLAQITGISILAALVLIILLEAVVSWFLFAGRGLVALACPSDSRSRR